ncbi:MAG: photosynthetic reaction center subunit H [Myxococcota bacterium]
MPTGAFTEYADVAQIALYVFWIFFFGLVFYLRREDRREGYPLEFENGRLERTGPILTPGPKTYVKPHGHGTYTAPSFKRDERPVLANPTHPWPGAPLEPTGDPMEDGVGAASWVERDDVPELTREGAPMIVPMRAAEGYSIADGSRDPRGMPVIAADGQTVGQVKDVWVDRADQMARYLEVDLEGGGGPRLVPIVAARMSLDHDEWKVASIMSKHFPRVPTTKDDKQITLLEEERIMAYFAGGRRYADPSRLEPLV